MSEWCDFSDMSEASCAHCNPPDEDTTRRQTPGEKADNSHAREIFKSAVLEVRPGALIRDNGNATDLTVDGTKVWVKATLEPDGSKTSFQFHDGVRMLSVAVEYIAMVNTALGDIYMIRKVDADAEARLQLHTSTAGRITLKPNSPRVQGHLLAVSDIL